jgi:hypothetical protein
MPSAVATSVHVTLPGGGMGMNPMAPPTYAVDSASFPLMATRYKTKLCETFSAKHKCPYAYRCMFAHGRNQLRSAQQNVDDGLVTEGAIKVFQQKQVELSRQRKAAGTNGTPFAAGMDPEESPAQYPKSFGATPPSHAASGRMLGLDRVHGCGPLDDGDLPPLPPPLQGGQLPHVDESCSTPLIHRYDSTSSCDEDESSGSHHRHHGLHTAHQHPSHTHYHHSHSHSHSQHTPEHGGARPAIRRVDSASMYRIVDASSGEGSGELTHGDLAQSTNTTYMRTPNHLNASAMSARSDRCRCRRASVVSIDSAAEVPPENATPPIGLGGSFAGLTGSFSSRHLAASAHTPIQTGGSVERLLEMSGSGRARVRRHDPYAVTPNNGGTTAPSPAHSTAGPSRSVTPQLGASLYGTVTTTAGQPSLDAADRSCTTPTFHALHPPHTPQQQYQLPPQHHRHTPLHHHHHGSAHTTPQQLPLPAHYAPSPIAGGMSASPACVRCYNCQHGSPGTPGSALVWGPQPISPGAAAEFASPVHPSSFAHRAPSQYG